MQTAALVRRLLCAHDGRMELNELKAQISGLAYRDELEAVLQNLDVCVITTKSDGSKIVVARTNLRLCKTKECNGCNNLHLCKRYLFGECPYNQGRSFITDEYGQGSVVFKRLISTKALCIPLAPVISVTKRRRPCRYGHDLMSGHNISVLRQHELLELDRSELCILLLQNDNSLLPQVCFMYNKGSVSQCSDDCRRLHICERYIRGNCDGSMKCLRSHDFYEPHPSKTLQDRGVHSQLMESLPSIYQNILALWDSSNQKTTRSTRPANARDRTEICLFHIKNYCKQGNKCFKVHFHLPYKWEVRDENGWKVLPDNEEVEKAFCDPARTYSEGAMPVHFDTMRQGPREVRRLSTPSSVLQPTFILTTKWTWYWENEFGCWTHYGLTEGAHHASTITSEQLEKKYQEDSSATIEFTAGKHTYELNMQDMIQTNKRIGTRRLVRRRPVFVSATDVHSLKSSHSHHTRGLPRYWDKSSIPDTGFKRVVLRKSYDEYQKILDLFKQTMSGFTVKSIERVQNRALWEIFQWQSDVMKKNDSKGDSERLLFHGTNSKHIDAICQQNFDWRLCGTHGTAYGKGSYFARDAIYSHRYTEDSETRSMFVCRVLVGQYTQGHPSYVRPPPKGNDDNILYDSCVNSISNPSIFVVFEKQQVYPEYLIQYVEGVEPEPEPESILNPVRPRTRSLSNSSHIARRTPQHYVKPDTPFWRSLPQSSPLTGRMHRTHSMEAIHHLRSLMVDRLSVSSNPSQSSAHLGQARGTRLQPKVPHNPHLKPSAAPVISRPAQAGTKMSWML